MPLPEGDPDSVCGLPNSLILVLMWLTSYSPFSASGSIYLVIPLLPLSFCLWQLVPGLPIQQFLPFRFWQLPWLWVRKLPPHWCSSGIMQNLISCSVQVFPPPELKGMQLPPSALGMENQGLGKKRLLPHPPNPTVEVLLTPTSTKRGSVLSMICTLETCV